jgi:glyoxylase I family protein
MNLHGLDYVIMLCEDLASMKVFYHEVLGIPIERDWGNWIELRLGTVLLTLRPRGRSYDGPKASGSAGVQLAFRLEPPEVDAWYAELLQKQVEILEPPRDWDYGHRTLFFRDPEGNILEIYAEI